MVMEMVERKTAELTDIALDWATFCAIWPNVEPTINIIEPQEISRPPLRKPIMTPKGVYLTYFGAYNHKRNWDPSFSWECVGPLIDQHGVSLIDRRSSDGYWHADIHAGQCMTGNTPLEAICRAIVAAKLGDTVQIPSELA